MIKEDGFRNGHAYIALMGASTKEFVAANRQRMEEQYRYNRRPISSARSIKSGPYSFPVVLRKVSLILLVASSPLGMCCIRAAISICSGLMNAQSVSVKLSGPHRNLSLS